MEKYEELNKYTVYVTRTFQEYFIVTAENEEKAIDKAEELFEKITVNGYEMLPFEVEIYEEQGDD